jgi:hypothetical protein
MGHLSKKFINLEIFNERLGQITISFRDGHWEYVIPGVVIHYSVVFMRVYLYSCDLSKLDHKTVGVGVIGQSVFVDRYVYAN